MQGADSVNLFVYGTLMRTLYNYKAMRLDDSPFIGTARTLGKGRMLCEDLIPFVSFSNGAVTEISGEVFRVTPEKMEYLGTLEIPYGYVRENVEVTMSDGKVLRAILYAYNLYSDEFVSRAKEELTGDFWNYINNTITKKQRQRMICEE